MVVIQHQNRVFKGLEEVRPILRCIFAASVAERLFFHCVGIPTATKTDAGHRAALDLVWDSAVDGPGDELRVRRLAEDYKAGVAGANHAIAALAYALLALNSPSGDTAGWAGVRGLDAVAEFLRGQLYPGKIVFTREENERMRQQPAFTRELERQRRDVDELRAVDYNNRSALLSVMRQRSNRESQVLFD